MKLITTIAILLLTSTAFATGGSPPPPDDPGQEQEQDQGQHQGQEQDQGQIQGQHQGQETSVSVENAAAGGAANNEGNEQQMSITSNYEAQAPDIVMIPNNNTEKCLRIWGISFSTQDGGGGIGIPWRSAPCDFEQAADDAFAAGERDIGWFWKCKNKNLYKPFKSKGESNESAQGDCLNEMVKGVTQTQMISTLKAQLDEVKQMRQDELVEYRASEQKLKEACNESKNRMMEACQK